jgi:hypothetical protein
MNCTFCNTILYDSGTTVYYCTNHQTQIGFICSGLESQPTIEYIQFHIEQPAAFLIELNIEKQSCKLFTINKKKIKEILTLNYIPNITADNAKHWLDRLLNLKAFS